MRIAELLVAFDFKQLFIVADMIICRRINSSSIIFILLYNSLIDRRDFHRFNYLDVRERILFSEFVKTLLYKMFAILYKVLSHLISSQSAGSNVSSISNSCRSVFMLLEKYFAHEPSTFTPGFKGALDEALDVSSRDGHRTRSGMVIRHSGHERQTENSRCNCRLELLEFLY